MKKYLKTNKHKVGIAFLLMFFSLSVIAQEITVTGIVSDINNIPIAAANIIVKDTPNVGTSTDFDGKYTITVNSDDTLVFSYIGYETKEVPVNSQTSINVKLEEGGFGLEQVVVTSRKQSENIQEVPISVAAFSAKTLETRGINNVAQIADYIPNVEIDVSAAFSGSQSILAPFIRGIGQTDFAITFEPAVGLYVDGVYFARSVGAIIDLLDVERVEALKGPQGTLFGRNTIGGAINVTTKDPSRTFAVNGQITTGNFNRLDTKVAVDIPLIEDKLLSSFAVSLVNRDGHVRRIPFTGETNDDLANPRTPPFSEVGVDNDQGNQNNDTYRTKLVWVGSEKFKATFIGDYTRVRENQNGSTLLDVFDEFNGAPTIAGAFNACSAGLLPPELCADIARSPGLDLNGATPFDNRFVTGDPFTTFATGDGGSRIDAGGVSLSLDYEVNDNIDFKSITGYRKLRSQFGEDQDFGPTSFASAGFVMPQEQFTQEFQFIGKSDKLKWVGGLYYFTENGAVTDQVVLGNGLVQVFGENTVDNQSYAAFGQATYNITDKWSVTGGARFTFEEKELTGRQREFNSFVLRVGLVTPADFPTDDLTLFFPPGENRQTFSEPTFRLGSEYKFSENIFLYGYFAQGFKSGGWSTRVTSPVLEAPIFDPENADTYEIGLKTDFADNRFRFNVSAFYTDYQNLQVTVQRGISPFVENAAQAEIKGVEFDLQWKATRNLLLSGNAGFLDAEYTDIEEGALIQEDFGFVNTPEFSSSVSLDWTIPFGDDKGRLIFHIDASSKSEIFNNVENTELLRQPGLTLVNTALSYEGASRDWKVTVGGTNITNETYLVSGFFNPGAGLTYGTYARPAEFNVGVSYKFF